MSEQDKTGTAADAAANAGPSPAPETPAAPAPVIPLAQLEEKEVTVAEEIAELIREDQSAGSQPPTLLYTSEGALMMAKKIMALIQKPPVARAAKGGKGKK